MSISVEKARLYDQYRLPYAREMVDDLLNPIGEFAVVADIGAGTGQLARLFAPRCTQVYAVEPDCGMTAAGLEASRAYPNIHFINACAEATALADHSIDLMVIGNAFHRFKAEAISELLRVLKPMGWAAVISYTFTHQAFADALFPKLAQLKGFAARSAQTWHRLPVSSLFGAHSIQTRRYEQSYSEDWGAFWGSAQSGIEAPEPGDEEFERFEAINRNVFNAFSVDGRIRIDYETQVQFGQPKTGSDANRTA